LRPPLLAACGKKDKPEATPDKPTLPSDTTGDALVPATGEGGANS